MKNKSSYFTIIFTILLGPCFGQPCPSDDACVTTSCTEVTYQPSSSYLENPSRGFVDLITTLASSFSPLTVSRLEALRESDGNTMVWRQYVLDNYVESSIPQSFIEDINADMEVVREAKFTAVIRFMYTNVGKDEAPYGDASQEWMLTHIDELEPFFSTNQDVIDVVQAGFIGIWGEWYYTTYFGDPNFFDCSPQNIRCLTPENWEDRTDVLLALLNAVPDTIQVQVRVPTYKQEPMGDYTPTTLEEMLAGTNKARTGHHNDCFLASSTDFGTYINKTAEYPYLQSDTLYTVMGGEMCSQAIDEPFDRHECPTALKEMSELHWSYMNQGYNRDVLDVWVEQGCYNDIHRSMGYRLQLIRGEFSSGSLCPRDELHVILELQNVGYAAPYKQRTPLIILRNTENQDMWEGEIEDVDIRQWLPGEVITLKTLITVPSQIEDGSYEVLFALRDEMMASFSDYNILFANTDVPEHTAGLNDLQYTLDITCSGRRRKKCKGKKKKCKGKKKSKGKKRRARENCEDFSEAFHQTPSDYNRVFCGFPDSGCEEDSGFYVENHSFEFDGGWDQHGDNGFTYSSDTASHGSRSALVTDGGARQVWSMPQGTNWFCVTADSSNVGLTGSDNNNYSIYCDVRLADGSWSYGHTAQFDTSTSSWHTRSLQVDVASGTVDEAWCYAMFRDQPTGSAYFDNFRVTTSTTGPGSCSV